MNAPLVSKLRLLDRITLDGCFERILWPQLHAIALIEPKGDVLPVRARYGDTWNIGLDPVR